MSEATVLLVEDDLKLASLTANFLSKNNLDVRLAHSCSDAMLSIDECPPDIVLLDLNLPDGDGVDLCQRIRQQSFDRAILMLTARDSALEQINGLDAGADDYIYKPVEPMVLLARIRAFLRQQSRQYSPKDVLQYGELEIHVASQQVFFQDREITVTGMEFQLLLILAKRAGEIVSRDDLNRQARGIEYDGLDRTVDVRISKLRKKFFDDGEHPKKIRTIRSKGYLFVADAW